MPFQSRLDQRLESSTHRSVRRNQAFQRTPKLYSCPTQHYDFERKRRGHSSSSPRHIGLTHSRLHTPTLGQAGLAVLIVSHFEGRTRRCPDWLGTSKLKEVDCSVFCLWLLLLPDQEGVFHQTAREKRTETFPTPVLWTGSVPTVCIYLSGRKWGQPRLAVLLRLSSAAANVLSRSVIKAVVFYQLCHILYSG